MKKLIFTVLAFVFALSTAPVAQAANTNNFQITSYNADMTLARDTDQRSTLEVKETFVAEFPSFDQNRGLTRAFVKDYDGHSLSFNLKSVTDENGTSLKYNWSGDTLRIGEEKTFVHGRQTYVITYALRDVTRFYADTGRDEFYWDVLGTEWQVPIAAASIELIVDPSLRASFTGNNACYTGTFRSTDRCGIYETPNGFRVDASNLAAGQGITVAVGFEQGTFAAYKQTAFEKFVFIWTVVQVVVSVIGLAIIAGAIIWWYRARNRSSELKPIAPEYLPPPTASVMTSSRIGGYALYASTAQLIDLAVRHFIKIYEVKPKTIFKNAEYEIAIERNISTLRWEEQELLHDMFGKDGVAVGQRLNLKKLVNNRRFQTALLDNTPGIDRRIREEYGLRAKDEGLARRLRIFAFVLLGVAVLTISPAWLLPIATLFGLSASTWRLTDEGLALRRYLEGLKMYISVAEQDRLKLLQSPDGAEKVREITGETDVSNPKMLVKLYERVLPYAVLFNQEKKWSKQLGAYYQTSGASPDWYAGQSGVFNAVLFSQAISSFSSVSNSASSFSSNSGGSGGGGFSGGGGGGGGGGGW